MTNTSASGGQLLPAGTPAPAEDADLDAIFQAVIAAISGLPGQYVRPRWQPVPPQQPEPTTDWCAVGIGVSHPDAGPYFGHDTVDPGTDTYIRHEQLDVLASFYGPSGKRYTGILRDGLAVRQNTEALAAVDVAFVESGSIRALPEFVNQQWIRRWDLPLRFRRKVTRTYPVRNVLSADIAIATDSGISTVLTVPSGT
jgi:hypothetical protein